MRLRGLVPVLLVALLVTPAALAGSPRRPEIEDEIEPRMRDHLDIVKAWIVPESAGVRFFVETRAGAPSDTVHLFLFHVEETSAEVGGAVGYGNDGVLRTHLLEDGTRDLNALIRPGFEELANGGLLAPDRDGRVLSAVIPWGLVPGLHEDAELHGLSAATAYFHRDSIGWRLQDTASTDEIVVASIPSPLSRMTAGVFPILVPAWALPTIVAACTLLGAGGGFAIGRRAKNEATAAVATSVPVRAPLPPPGQRFRAAPPPQPLRPGAPGATDTPHRPRP